MSTNATAFLPRALSLLDLGLQPYEPVHQLQVSAVECVRSRAAPEVVILVEHTPTITLGRRADPAHILASAEALQRSGITIQRVERGGDVTYHGPGQLVMYPIIRLHEYNLGASDYMHRLEEVVITALDDLAVSAGRREGLVGVWIGNNKICAMGVRIRGGVTMHGLALNVDPEMAHWQTIIPCGIQDAGVTSLRQVLGIAPAMEVVKERLTARFAEAFDVTLVTCQDATPWIGS